MNKSWSNTVLVAYSALPKIAEEIDFGVKSRVKSSFQGRNLKNGVTNEQLIGEILQLNDEKRRIVNLRFIAYQALSKMAEQDRNALYKRLVEKKTFQQIGAETGISLRTVFRRVEKAEESFALNMKKAGYGEDWLEKEYGLDIYISPIRARVLDDRYFVAKNI